MKKHELNKDNFISDVILTISIVISIIISAIIMYGIHIKHDHYKIAVFLIILFILIKIWYNGIMHVIRRMKNKKSK